MVLKDTSVAVEASKENLFNECISPRSLKMWQEKKKVLKRKGGRKKESFLVIS